MAILHTRDHVLTVKEAAERLRVTPDTVRAMLKRGQLQGKRLHKTGPWRIDAGSVDRALGKWPSTTRGHMTSKDLHRLTVERFMEGQRAREGR